MEIINYFISFIIGALFTLVIFFIDAIIKDKKQINKVHFYVARDKNGTLALYIGKPFRGHTTFDVDYLNRVFCLTYNIDHFGLKYEDFDSLKWEDEPIEVFLNLEE